MSAPQSSLWMLPLGSRTEIGLTPHCKSSLPRKNSIACQPPRQYSRVRLQRKIAWPRLVLVTGAHHNLPALLLLAATMCSCHHERSSCHLTMAGAATACAAAHPAPKRRPFHEACEQGVQRRVRCWYPNVSRAQLQPVKRSCMCSNLCQATRIRASGPKAVIQGTCMRTQPCQFYC